MGRKKGDTLLVSKARRLKALTAFNSGMSVTEIQEAFGFYDYAHAYRSIKQAIGDDTDKEAKLYRDRQKFEIDRDRDLINSRLYPKQNTIEKHSETIIDPEETKNVLGIDGNILTEAKEYVDTNMFVEEETMKGLLPIKYKIQDHEAKLFNLYLDKNNQLSGDVIVHVVQDE